MKSASSETSISSVVSLEDEDEKKKMGAEKMLFVLQELVDTEKEYVGKMKDVIKVGMGCSHDANNYVNV